ncbi:MAG: protein-disulfide reductase DsbD domain-containing protein [Asticcacaulis sp.]
MTSVLRFFISLLACLCALALPAQAADGQSAHIKARLIAQSLTVAPDGDVVLALDYTPSPGWHTYWVNPGDTGLPPKFKWNLPDGVSIGDTEYPTPDLLPAFGLMSYGFTGQTVLLMPLHNGAKLVAGDDLPLKAHVDFLVCADVCIPESLDVSLTLKVGAPQPGPEAALIKKAQEALPHTPAISGTIALNKGVVELGFPLSGKNAQGAYFFPHQGNVVQGPAPQKPDMGAEGFSLRVPAAGEALPAGDLSGVLKLSDGTAYEVRLTRAPLAASVHGWGDAPQDKADGSLSGILLAMLFAFTGGLILNLMPCVFPVLSMKLLSLARSGHDKGLAKTEALAYGAGTILTFVVLAAVLLLARLFGQAIGWGFQLQSPYVTAALSLVMLLVALNMSGLFNVGSSLQAVGGLRVSEGRPRLGAFLTGVLAVVVAAPCTAPFMATAIGAALAQGGVMALTIFVALGIGFALPFVALTFLIVHVPAVARALPKPGKWMDVLKHILAIPMYLAAVWLIWVFAQQVQMGGVILLVLALGIVALAVARLSLPKFVKPVLLVGGLALCLIAASLPSVTKTEAPTAGDMAQTAFTLDALTALRAEGRPVLVDMTAAWCVTCKVNEARVLHTKEVAKAFKETGTVYMVGDWTNQDAEISRYLSLYGRSGVPLYVYYGADKAEPVVLPQILSKEDVLKRLQAGA